MRGDSVKATTSAKNPTILPLISQKSKIFTSFSRGRSLALSVTANAVPPLPKGEARRPVAADSYEPDTLAIDHHLWVSPGSIQGPGRAKNPSSIRGKDFDYPNFGACSRPGQWRSFSLRFSAVPSARVYPWASALPGYVPCTWGQRMPMAGSFQARPPSSLGW